MDTPQVSIVPMNEAQFKSYFEDSTQAYAKASPLYRHLPLPEAIARARTEFNTKVAPQGFATPGHHFLAIYRADQQIGYLHFSAHPPESAQAYGWNFFIQPEFRRQGVGKKSMQLAREFLKNAGFTKVMLNVMADNLAAIELYQSIGFSVSQMNMERAL